MCDPAGGHCYLVSGLATPILRRGCCSRFRPGPSPSLRSQRPWMRMNAAASRRRVKLLSRPFRTFAMPPFVLPPTLPLTPQSPPIRLPPVLPGLRDVDTTLADAEGLFDEAPYEDELARFSWERGRCRIHSALVTGLPVRRIKK